MSRTSLKSASRRGKVRREGKQKSDLLKPYGFCCLREDYDEETRFDQRKPPYESSMTALDPIHESPRIKIRTQWISHGEQPARKKSKYNKTGDSDDDGNPCVKARGPLMWYEEDEISLAKNMVWSEKQKVYIEEGNKNVAIAKAKVQGQFRDFKEAGGPQWYQDLNDRQMRNLLSLEELMIADHEESVTGRTQRALIQIGVTSTFVRIAPLVIRKLRKMTKLNPINFLREIYKKVTGYHFEDEGPKSKYDCNERIILSSIAFLTLPETVFELNKRLPPIQSPELPPKPKPPQQPPMHRYKSAYEEPLYVPPDWTAYRKRMSHWRELCKLVAKPKAILAPPNYGGGSNYNDPASSKEDESITKEGQMVEEEIASVKRKPERKRKYHAKDEEAGERNDATSDPTPKQTPKTTQILPADAQKNDFDFSIPRLPGGSNQKFDFTISGLGEKAGPVEYKICGTLKPPLPRKKSWLGEKDAHYIISGVSEDEDPPQCPVTYVMTGIANVTPKNSDEEFFAELKLGDGPKKVYPSGRKNLSRNWQEWLQDADEEFARAEREANRLIKSIEATMRLVVPGPFCDTCCSCRQTRKTNLKWHDTKTPYMVIDSMAEGKDQNKYIVGSMAMHSPLPSPPESTINLLEVVASRDNIDKKLVINGVTNEAGKTTFYISGVMQDREHIKKKTTPNLNPPPKPLRNVPACICTIEQMFNAGVSPRSSSDDIPMTKKEGACFGKKYRPAEAAGYTCKESPHDKSCRRNPFKKTVNALKRRRDREKDPGPGCGVGEKDEVCAGPPEKKRMFSLPAFNPCGDEDDMAVCGGPWGAKNIPDPKVVAAKLEEVKKMLKGPPCGGKPGRAICGGTWGDRVPLPKKKKGSDESTEEDEDEDEDEDERKAREKEKKLKEKEEAKEKERAKTEAERLRRSKLKRDDLCDMRSAREMPKTGMKDVPEENPKDPIFCDSDNPWDKMRTAPTVNPWGNEYEDSLNLTKRQLPSSELNEMQMKRKNGKMKNGNGEASKAQDDSPKAPRSENGPAGVASAKNQAQQLTTKQKSPQSGKSSANSRKPRTSASGKNKNGKNGGTRKDSQSGKKTAESNAKVRIADPNTKSANGKNRIGKNGSSAKDSRKEIGKNGTAIKTKETGKGSNLAGDSDKKRMKNGKESPMRQGGRDQSPNGPREARVKKQETRDKEEGNNNKPGSPIEHDKPKGERKKRPNRYEFVNKYEERWLKREVKLKKLPPCILGKDDMKQDRFKSKGGKGDYGKDKSSKSKTQNEKPPSPPAAVKKTKEYDVKPAVMPKEPAKAREYVDPRKPSAGCTSRPLDGSCDCPTDDDKTNFGKGSKGAGRSGPFGWKTESQQKLPPEKTLAYLAKPNAQVRSIPVRKGGKVCSCRKNRANKKILLYNIGGTVEQLKGKSKKAQPDAPRLIEGVYYATPPPSPRISEEFIPEYELYESPYDMCLRKRMEASVKYMQRFLGPESILPKKSKNAIPCACAEEEETAKKGEVCDEDDAEAKREMTEKPDAKPPMTKKEKKKKKTAAEAKKTDASGGDDSKGKDDEKEEEWKSAFKDEGLVNFFVRCRDEIPCWLRCAKFTKDGCCVTPKRLEVRKPVCECRYERKVLRREEAKKNWIQRQQRLKTYKKKPLLNVADTSRPMGMETKLMISNVKRIPREDEYIDDVKYCVTGVAENYTMGPAQLVVSGIAMESPVVTPETSKPDIPCMCGHKHWSVTKIEPEPEIVVPSQATIEEEEPYVAYQSCGGRGPCRPQSEPIDASNEDNRKDGKRRVKKSETNSRVVDKAVVSKKSEERGKSARDSRSEPEVLTKKLKESTKTASMSPSKTHDMKDSGGISGPESHPPKGKLSMAQTARDKGDGDNSDKIATTVERENDLLEMMKVELEKMAEEGFIFAKLPNCSTMPQLRFWIAYRKGIVFSDEDKKTLMHNTMKQWNRMETRRATKLEPVSLNMERKEIATLTYDRAIEVKQKIELARTKFLSELRKLRVWETRAVWASMEFGKFPCKSFKDAFFTYLPGKEADGHVFRPWQISETKNR